MESNINHLLKTAITAHQKGKLEEAEMLYREVLSTEPKQSDANHNLGLILTSKDKIEEALILLKIATEINPNIEQYWISYINALIKKKNFKDAVTISNKALKLKPNFVNFHFLLGLILNKLDKLEEAGASYRKAIDLKPDFIEAYNNLSIILNKLNRVEEAKEIFNKSLQLKSDYNKKIALEKHQEAKKYCENVIKIGLKEYPEESAFVFKEVDQRDLFSRNNLVEVKNWNKHQPLLTWPFIDFINTLDLKNIILHELGAGSSTIWFSNKFKNIESYETNQDWYEKLKPLIKSNVSLKLTKLENIYECKIQFKSNDWLLIDFAGKRTKFIQELVKLSDDLIPAQIILDNTEWYRNGAKILIDRGYSEIPFFGFKSGQSIIACTSLFILKNHFKLKILTEFHYPMFSKKMNNLWDIID
jgi:tetratricopeptide (TPR) repeat protein